MTIKFNIFKKILLSILTFLVILSSNWLAIFAYPSPVAQVKKPIEVAQVDNQYPFYWEFINVDIDVQENGDMLISEVQKYVFPQTYNNERYRYISLNKIDKITDVSVSENGKPLPVSTGIENNQFWIRWQHSLNPPEAHTFVLNYRVIGGLHINDTEDQVYWKAIFWERKAPIEKAKVTVRLPKILSGKIKNFKSFGVLSSSVQVDSQTIQFIAQQSLQPIEELDVQVTFPHDILKVSVPNWQNLSLWSFIQATFQWIFGIIVILCPFILISGGGGSGGGKGGGDGGGCGGGGWGGGDGGGCGGDGGGDGGGG